MLAELDFLRYSSSFGGESALMGNKPGARELLNLKTSTNILNCSFS